MLDNDEHIVEGTMSNLFLVKAGALFTPGLSQCGVAGIVRELVLEFAQLNAIPCQEIALTKETLWWADEIFVTNSLIGIWPVRQLEAYTFNVGPVTRLLQKLFNSSRLAEG